ncbi:hypothetical protein CPAV1605_681 [seawater metagenome]|uniref:Saposin B-type domain-containing protein n=1 Tax=seawater metagenome TaxID=1561972 RepID=A0A5E8CIP5_9ZZZZ
MKTLYILVSLLLVNNAFSLSKIESEFNGNTTCSTCKFVVNVIDYDLSVANKTIGIIASDVKQICQLIKGPSGRECEIICNDIQEICNWLGHGLNSTQVCQKLHMCNNTLSHAIC